MKKMYIRKIIDCFDCPYCEFKRFGSAENIKPLCEIGGDNGYDCYAIEIPNFPEIPEWCPLLNYNKDGFKKYLKEQMKDPEFKKEYERLQTFGKKKITSKKRIKGTKNKQVV